MDKNNFSVIFQDGPIGRAYLNYKNISQRKFTTYTKKNFYQKK